jgi:hypothetical protein
MEEAQSRENAQKTRRVPTCPLSILFCHEDEKFDNHSASEVVIKWNFCAAMPPLPWLKKH